MITFEAVSLIPAACCPGINADCCVTHKTLLNIVKHCETLWNTHKTLSTTLKTLWNTIKHHEMIEHLPIDATTSTLKASISTLSWATSVPGTECDTDTRCGVSVNISDCGVGITPQMHYRVTNHWDIGTFSRPENFLTSISQNFLLNIKDVEFDFKVILPRPAQLVSNFLKLFLK